MDDPRELWHPALALVGIRPWEVEKYRPDEVQAAEQFVPEMLAMLVTGRAMTT